MNDPIRAATRHAHAIRDITRQTPEEALRFLLEEAGELAKAIRKGDTANVAEEIADVAIVIDHIADRLGLPGLPVLVARKVAADEKRLGVAS